METALSGWENFYVIVGSSAGALIGLQFVVITLIAEIPTAADAAGAGAFATPTITHFTATLLLSALLSAPWKTVNSAAWAWGLLGLAGVIYELVVIRRMRTQSVYKPVLEDWMFHAWLPLAAYVTLAVSALCAPAHDREALFAVCGGALLLLFIGIHNAWDAVMWHVFVRKPKHLEKTRARE